jgi:Tol biopolymer transport system component
MAVASVIAVLGCGAATSAEASFPGDNGKILFSSNATGDYDLYTMGADGSDLRNLTRTPERDEIHAEWSADGRRIVFERTPPGLNLAGSEVWVMNGDASAQLRLTDAPGRDGHPTWSPDGERIAFMSYRDGDADLYTIAPDGRGLRQLTDLPDDEARPRYFAHGKLLVYTRRVGLGFGGFSVHTIGTDGTRDRALTPPALEAAGADPSPRGRRLVLHDNFCATCPLPDIVVMKANGSGETELTSNFGWNIEPNWSPDGEQILFEHIEDPAVSFNADIYVMHADGSRRRNLTRSPAADDILSDWQAR